MKITTNSIDLYYEKSGQGKPLLLLHGNGQDHHMFSEIAQKLKGDFTVYAIDSRNHGQSSKTDNYSYDTMAQDIYSFITDMALEKVNLVGFSDGAIISLLLALKHQEVINKMALLGVNLKPTDFKEKIYNAIKERYEQDKDPLDGLMLEQPDIELSEVKNVEVPVLVVAAEKELYKPETYQNLVQALPSAKLKIMDGHMHETYIEHQDILYPDLLEFFKGK